MSKIKKICSVGAMGISGVGALVVPIIAFAQASATNPSTGSTLAQTSDLNGLVGKAIGLFNSAIYLIIALAILTFVWNVYQYFIVKDPENRKEASLYVMYSVIGIFVILSFWGLVNIISNTLNINTSPGTLNVSNLIGNITGSSGTSGSSAGTPNLFSPTSGGSSIYTPSATNNSGSSFTPSSQSQAAYQQQANQAQAALQANGCLTVSLGTVNTPTCQSLQSQYTTAQNQANGTVGHTIIQNSNGTYTDQTSYNNCISSGGTQAGCQYSATYSSGQSAGTTANTSGSSLSQMQADFQANCINSAGGVIQIPSCQNMQSQINAAQSSNCPSGSSSDGNGNCLDNTTGAPVGNDNSSSVTPSDNSGSSDASGCYDDNGNPVSCD